MPKIVLLPHGDTISPAGHLTYQSTLDNIKITIAIPSHLSEPATPQPRVICGPENAPQRTSILIADMLQGNIEVCAALGETIDTTGLRAFVHLCLASANDVIIVSHTKTIKAFMAILTATSGEAYIDRRTEQFVPRQFTVIDTETHDIYTATAPANILA